MRVFALRRIMRIYPLLLCSFAAYAVLYVTGYASDIPTSAAAWLANIFLVQDLVHQPAINGVTWTLLIEMTWYAIFALAWRMAGAKGIGVLVMLFAAALLATAGASLIMGVRLPLGRLGFFYIALIGARLSQAYDGHLPWRRAIGECAVFFGVTLITNWVAFAHFRHPTCTPLQVILPWAIAPILFMGTLAMNVRGNGVSAFWAGPMRVLGALGQISYSIYLLHPLVIKLTYPHAQTPIVTASIWVATGLISVLAFHAIEKPGVELGRKAEQWLNRSKASGLAAVSA